MEIPARFAPLVAILLGVLFLVAAVSNFASASYLNGGIGAAMGTVLLLAGIIAGAEQRANEHFIDWLADEAAAIESGESRWTRDTPAVRYHGAISLIVIGFNFTSRYGLDDPPSGVPVHLGPPGTGPLFTAFTLLLGWWRIPSGPVLVLQMLHRNRRRGGETLGDVIDRLRDEEVLADARPPRRVGGPEPRRQPAPGRSRGR